MITNYSIQTIDSKLKEFYENSSLHYRTNSLKNQVLAIPTKFNDYTTNEVIIPRTLKLNEKILLGLLHWYMDDEIRVIINLALEEHWGNEFQEIKASLLFSKNVALGYLMVQDRFNNYDFFGNILTEKLINKISFNIKIKKKNHSLKGIKEINFCEYKDKGSGGKFKNEKIVNYRKILTIQEQIERDEKIQYEIESLLAKIFEYLKLNSA